MDKQEGKVRIADLRWRWQLFNLTERFCISILWVLPASTVVILALNLSLWLILAATFFGFCLLVLRRPFWMISLTDVAGTLNTNYPELEESAGLLLLEKHELNRLQFFQQRKIAGVLAGIRMPILTSAKVLRLVLYLFFGLGLFFGLCYLKSATDQASSAGLQPVSALAASMEQKPGHLKRVQIRIIPPAYTGLSSRVQNQLNLKAESESMVSWEMRTSVPVKKISMIFNDQEKISLQAVDEQGKSWVTNRKITKPGFYQLEIDGRKSDLYQIELVGDRPVSIQITRPAPHTTIDYGQPKKIGLRVNLQDDYGIKNAFISATMASGKGEGVSFTEKQILFNNSFDSAKSMSLQKELDLSAMGMKPGDELYYFVSALDTHGQASRSDVYFVSIADTTELMSLAGISGGVNLVPEYFRSQRQIIMDAEKLLAEQVAIPLPQFKSRSNDLGTDQKVLRMRYGKFLGEESETEIGGGHDHEEEGHEHEESAAFGDVQAIIDSYAHKHDIAEDATFFDPEVKTRLKAVLTEMWNSELKLRTYQPQQALPYAYKALRLLKDLQQKSRAFVAKTTVQVAHLKEEKRYTGELNKIVQPLKQQQMADPDREIFVLQKGLSDLDQMKTGEESDNDSRINLWEIEKYIVIAAVDHPDTYLPALKAIRNLQGTKSMDLPLINRVQNAIRKMLKQGITIPQAGMELPSSALYQQYFNHLKNDLK